MRAHFGLPSVTSDDTDKKKPLSVKFEIPYFTVSGIQVNSSSMPCTVTLTGVVLGALPQNY